MQNNSKRILNFSNVFAAWQLFKSNDSKLNHFCKQLLGFKFTSEIIFLNFSDVSKREIQLDLDCPRCELLLLQLFVVEFGVLIAFAFFFSFFLKICNISVPWRNVFLLTGFLWVHVCFIRLCIETFGIPIRW